jgi:hypothetical protein
MKYFILIILLVSNITYAASKSASQRGSHIRENSQQLAGSHYSDIYNRMIDARAGNYGRESGSLWSGRCFTKTEPNTPIAAALLFRSHNDGASPIGSQGLQIASVWKLNAYPEYYDNMSPYQVSANYVTPYYDRSRDSHYLYLSSGTKTALRRDGRYIYEAILDSRDQTSAICYYFIKNY